jgi:hypothetical protein
MATSGAEIQHVGCAARAKVVESADVRIGQIRHVNVVTNGGAVQRRILIAGYSHFSLRIRRGCENIGGQVGFTIVIIAAPPAIAV